MPDSQNIKNEAIVISFTEQFGIFILLRFVVLEVADNKWVRDERLLW